MPSLANLLPADKIVGAGPLLLVVSLPVLASWHTPEVAARVPALLASPEQQAITPPPLLLRPIDASDAVALNAMIPFSAAPHEPAPPYRFAGDSTARAQALECLASAIYYEAAGEPIEGQQAVAQVVLNRVRHPSFPASICGVVYQGSTLPTGCQFSFTCDGSLQRQPSRHGWVMARAVADAALKGFVYAPVGLATHYHTDQVVPYWATSLAKSIQVGAHIFYRWTGAAGRVRSFTQEYSLAEADPLRLRASALIADGIWPAWPRHSPPEPVTIGFVVDADVIRTMESLGSLASSQTVAADAELTSQTTAPPAASAGTIAGQVPRLTIPGPGSNMLPAPANRREEESSAPKLLASTGRGGGVRGDELALRRFYGQLAARAEELAEKAASDWQIYTGTVVQSKRILLNHGLPPRQVLCSGGAEAPKSPIANEPPYELRAADLFISAGLAQDSLRSPKARGPAADAVDKSVAPYREEIVRAVFARIAALSGGGRAGRLAVQEEVSRGFVLVPLFEQRLREFERRPDSFGTLNDYLPRLLAGLSQQDRKQAAARAATRCRTDLPAVT